MALTPEQITAQNFADFYQKILPYLNGGGMGMKLLWENPNPTSSFAEQDITLLNDDYDYLMINWNRTNSVSLVKDGNFTNIVAKGATSQLFSSYSTTGGIRTVSRQFRYNTDSTTSLHFLDAYSSTAGTASQIKDNVYTIPYKIYGIKLYSREDKGNTYSTSERIVGEWIDGKAIYQRTYELNTDLPGSSSSPNYVNITLSGLSSIGIDTLVDSSIVIKGKGTYANICLSDGYVSDSLNINNNSVAVSQSYTGNANVFTVLAYTIRYTKNT